MSGFQIGGSGFYHETWFDTHSSNVSEKSSDHGRVALSPIRWDRIPEWGFADSLSIRNYLNLKVPNRWRYSPQSSSIGAIATVSGSREITSRSIPQSGQTMISFSSVPSSITPQLHIQGRMLYAFFFFVFSCLNDGFLQNN